MHKFIKYFLFVLMIALVSIAVAVIINKVLHHKSPPNNTNNTNNTPMFGLALKSKLSPTADDRIIDLSRLKGKITCFWNWTSFTPKTDLGTLYNWSEDLNIQFLPMLWSCVTSSSTLPQTYNYLMLSNEPDMIGGCINLSKVCSGSGEGAATSSGYWINNGDYGCFSNTPESNCSPDNINTIVNNTFSYIIDKFIDQCTESAKIQPNAIIVSPAMSQNATGQCNVYKTDFRNGLPLPLDGKAPSLCDNEGCTCNGWLSILKKVALSKQSRQAQKDWWNNTLKVISIHAYYKYSHHVKNKILEYMDEFKDDIDNGKQIWLTEVAYVSTITDKDTYIKESADFAKTLLYANSIYSTILECKDINFIPDAKKDLPGLLTTTPFLFNGKTASWFDHGLTCVTWFCVDDWGNFLTGCNGVNPSNLKPITSFPFTNKEPNALYNSLFP